MDWDSWLTDTALHQIVNEDFSEYSKGCILNFLEHIDADGRIPMMIKPTTQLPQILDENTNGHKPCLAQHAAFVVKQSGDVEWLRPEFGKLLDVDVGRYAQEKENFKAAVREHCYDEKDGMYYSVDLNLLPIDLDSYLHKGAPRHWDCLLQRIGSWSGFLAMWAGIATPEQAERMVRENLLDEKAFWAPCGVRSLSKYEKMYVIKKSGNPSCWLGPSCGEYARMVNRTTGSRRI